MTMRCSPMKYDDSELIVRTLAGDQNAFSQLVEKYQDQIHALAWQKIGDYHIAQEITQDAFIIAYQKLATLKHHKRFAGWLYVITSNKCNMWHRKKRSYFQSIEETDPVELEEAYYTEYETQQREETSHTRRREIVQKLLSKLSESDRTVMTLHYLANLSCEEIGEFLGVSTNTVKSRLHRARIRLRKDETVIQESLSSLKLPPQLTENIIQKISHLDPVVPASSKPMLPWIVSTITAVLVFVLFGVGSQYLYRFQQPYNIDSTSLPTIEITDALHVVDTSKKPDLRIRTERKDLLDNNTGSVQKSVVTPLVSTETDSTKGTTVDDVPQKGTVSISGIVVNENGETMPGLELMIKPIEFGAGVDIIPRMPLDSWKSSVTGNQGGFSFRDIDPVSSQLVILPELGSDFNIISLKIGDMTFYSKEFVRNLSVGYGNLTFSIEPHMSLDNMVVTVKAPPMRIRGRILLDDGKPLVNGRINLRVQQRIRDTFLFFFRIDGSSSSRGGTNKTDSEGYFVSYFPDEAAEYSVSVIYEGVSAKTRWFRMKEGQRYDKIVLKLKGVKKRRMKQMDREKKRQSMWMVNPENGHAYKKVRCKNWKEAKIQSATEDAYLVTIESEDEQRWLEAIFSESLFYWIGLRTPHNGALWLWDNGEQLTYDNWLKAPESTDLSTRESGVPIAMEFYSKRWIEVGSDSEFLPFVKYAILEKENLQTLSSK